MSRAWADNSNDVSHFTISHLKAIEKFSVVVAGVMLESDDSVSSLSEIENLPTVTTAYGRLFI